MTRLALLLLAAGGFVALAAPVPKDHPWVTVRGHVVWPKGQEVPKPWVVPVNIDKEACCAGELLSDELLVDPKSRGVRNVLVWLRPDTKNGKESFPKDRVHPDLRKPKPANHVVKMEKCQFVPRMLAARDGDTWEFRNEGTVATNALVNHDDQLFNVVLPPGKGHVAKEPLRAIGASLYFQSNVHSWARGYGRVFDHPYFAVTDKDGAFEMKRVPKGEWRIVYWHQTGFHKGADGRLGFPLKVSGARAVHEVKDVGIELPDPR